MGIAARRRRHLPGGPPIRPSRVGLAALRSRRTVQGANPAGLLALALAVGLLAGCAAGASPGASASPSPSGSPIPQASFTGGAASARLEGTPALTWSGGWCTRDAADDWLAVNIGAPNGDEYFGLVVGASPFAPSDAQPVRGGGRFVGDTSTITWRTGGVAQVVVSSGLQVTIAQDLASGTFSGTTASGTSVRGSFACG